MASFRRMKRKGPLPFRYVLLLSFVFFLLSTAAGLYIINKEISPTLMRIAEIETKRIASLVINNAIQDEMEKNVDTTKLIEVKRDKAGKVTDTSFDSQYVTRMMAGITGKIQKYLREAEKGNMAGLENRKPGSVTIGQKNNGIVSYIPIGQATNNALLGGLGPMVPVRFYVMGDVFSDVKTNVKQYGINNALFEISISVKVDVETVIPFATKPFTVTTNVPVILKAVQGDVPEYFNSGGGSPPAIEMPGGGK
ncbi:sporulation protein YunB [Metabacillus sp. GX 13764]|uniref:sporulation protein YunB n=1 Tax=Metabacillus kandeliae TaxID=2900151 RepID=UPI001E37AFEC|nr:sporulation protein YunB [Metabacillus kandeliae]MCD7036267.1 sporulation protein YunB [Metabacillus kandeliae]